MIMFRNIYFKILSQGEIWTGNMRHNLNLSLIWNINERNQEYCEKVYVRQNVISVTILPNA